MAASRVFAFKNSSNDYYIYNSDKTSLIRISFDASNPDYSKWEDVDDLNSLTEDQLKLASGLDCVIHSYIDDDKYSVKVNSYSILQTTDESHFLLKGYRTINSMVITGSDTCKVLLSFDGRTTWKYYDYTTSTWITSTLNDIYKNSMTVSDVNTYLTSSSIFDKEFVRKGTLDYAISINTSESITDVTLNLPTNTNPTISNFICTILSKQQNTTHKDLIKITADIDDLDGDDLEYTFTFTNGSHNGTLATGKIPSINGVTNKEIFIDPENLYLGNNYVVLAVTDGYGGSATVEFYIIKTNNAPVLAYSYYKGKISISITDEDVIDTVSYRVTLNDGEEIVIDKETGETITPISEWEPFGAVPYSSVFSIPSSWIKFGETNKVKIEYKDDMFEEVIHTAEFTFFGEICGLLFIDPSEPEYDSSNNLNKYRYYSDSVGGLIKVLNINAIITGKESNTYEVGLINNSNVNIYSTVIIKSDIINEHYKLLLSEVRNPFEYKESIEFNNVGLNEPSPRLFYVKLVSYDKTVCGIQGYISTEGYNDDGQEEEEE